jgi:Trk-type K+ transport system membrane component
VFSKLVICAMMIRGRHRGLPYALDRAITLPNERNEDSETRYTDEAAPDGEQQLGVVKN